MAEPTLEEQFRDNIRDLIVILERFAPLCKSPDDLVGMLRLAISNDAQLALMMKELTPLSKRMAS